MNTENSLYFDANSTMNIYTITATSKRHVRPAMMMTETAKMSYVAVLFVHVLSTK